MGSERSVVFNPKSFRVQARYCCRLDAVYLGTVEPPVYLDIVAGYEDGAELGAV